MGNILFTQEHGDLPDAVKKLSEKVDAIAEEQKKTASKAEKLTEISKQQEKLTEELKKEKDNLIEELRRKSSTKSTQSTAFDGKTGLSQEPCKSCIENKEIEGKILNCEKKIKELEHKISEYEGKIKQNMTTINRLTSEKEDLKKIYESQLRECKSKLYNATHDNDVMRANIDGERRKLQQEITHLSDRCSDLEEKVRQKETGESKTKSWFFWSSSPSSSHVSDSTQKKSLQHQETGPQQKKHMTVVNPVRVLLYCAVQNKLLNEVTSNLQTILITQMECEGCHLQVEVCQEPRDRPPGLPLIVLCINASRLGTDVSQALQNITYEHSIAVVILHNKKIHALPSQSSERLLIGGNYKQLGLIVDLAYVTGDGMYPCDMNEKGLSKLAQFIKNFK